MLRSRLALVFCLWPACVLGGQTNQQASLQAILDKTESAVSLTANGPPFHAEMKIFGAKQQPEYEGSIKVDWASPTRYRVEARSAKFHQVKIVDGEQIQEQNDGDFYPGWLHSFATALLDPLSVKSLLVDPKASVGGSRSSSSTGVKICVSRDDKRLHDRACVDGCYRAGARDEQIQLR